MDNTDDTAKPKAVASGTRALYNKTTASQGAWKKGDSARAVAAEFSCANATGSANTKTWTKAAAGFAILLDVYAYAFDAAGAANTTTFTLKNFDTDLILHAHAQANDGTVCDKNHRLVLKATDQDVAFPAGMKAQDKCTIILEAPAKYGPGFKFSAHGYNDFTLGWVEFAEDALTTNGQLPVSDASKMFIGAYVVAEGPFINPQTTTDVGSTSALKKTDLTWYATNNNQYFAPGYIGHFLYYPSGTNTVQQTNGFSAVPSTEITSAFAALKSNYDDFNSKVNTYNPLKDKYNKALKDEKARKADSTRATFEAPIAIPERPCPPSQPIAWWGMDVDLKTITDFTTISDANKKLKKAGMSPVYMKVDDWTASNTYDYTITKVDNVSSKQDKALTLRKGYAIHSEGVTDDWKMAGKVFGRLGTGKDNLPENTTAFRYDTVTDKKTYMYVSTFPTKNGASVKASTIKARYATLATMTDFNAPSRPGAAANPDASGAKAIAVSTVAMALVASALY